jgi:hypothetical protein
MLACVCISVALVGKRGRLVEACNTRGSGTDTIVAALDPGVGGNGKSKRSPPSGKGGSDRSDMPLWADQPPSDAAEAEARERMADRKSGLDDRLLLGC